MMLLLLRFFSGLFSLDFLIFWSQNAPSVLFRLQGRFEKSIKSLGRRTEVSIGLGTFLSNADVLLESFKLYFVTSQACRSCDLSPPLLSNKNNVVNLSYTGWPIYSDYLTRLNNKIHKKENEKLSNTFGFYSLLNNKKTFNVLIKLESSAPVPCSKRAFCNAHTLEDN